MMSKKNDYESLRKEVDPEHPLYDYLFESWDWMSDQQKGYLADTIWRERPFDMGTFENIGEGDY